MPLLTDADLTGLKEAFGSVDMALAADGRQLVRIAKAALPRGCSPASTPVLMVADRSPARPQVYVKPGVKVPNGEDPRSTSVVSIEGEAWLQFSFKIEWDVNSHTPVQLVQDCLTRFGKN